MLALRLAPVALSAALIATLVSAPVKPAHAGDGCCGKAAASDDNVAEKLSIVGTAKAAGSFKTLVAALQAAGLVEALEGPGPFTVFAPTDEAFAKLPAGTVEALLKDIPKLKAILTYHVVSGKVTSGDVVKLKEAATLNGAKIKIDATKGVKINDATVTKADIEATNGVIHVIDTVILPPEPKPM